MCPALKKNTLAIIFNVCHWLWMPDHISILEQEFERRAITVILFGVLASEFHAESKNTNLFAGERHEFFGPKTKAGTLTVENFQCGTPFEF